MKSRELSRTAGIRIPKLAAVKEKYIFCALLVLVIGLMAYSPLAHGFIYPTGGDDTANHINDLANLTQNLDYSGRLISYYGITLLLPFTLLGLNPVTVFSVFNYLVIAGVFAAMWLLLRKFYGFSSALLGFFISVFVVYGTWYYFEDGTIFSIFNLYVLGLAALYALGSWLKTGSYRWLAAAGFLFIATSLVHSSSYLYIMASILLFCGAYGAYTYLKKDRVMLARTAAGGGVFLISMACAWAIWMHTLLPSLTTAMVGTITQGETSYVDPVGPVYWLFHYLNVGTTGFILVAALMLVIIFRQGSREQKEKIKATLNQPVSYMLGCFIFVLAVGAFSKLGYNYDRFSRDLATFTGLGTAVLLGVAITHYRFSLKPVWVAMVAVLMAASAVPLYNWLGNYTAVKAADRQAIDYLNSYSQQPVTVAHFSKLAPRIYNLYTADNVIFGRAYTVPEAAGADLVIYRSGYMTFYSEFRTPDDTLYITEHVIDMQNLLEELVRFGSGDEEVIIYRNRD